MTTGYGLSLLLSDIDPLLTVGRDALSDVRFLPVLQPFHDGGGTYPYRPRRRAGAYPDTHARYLLGHPAPSLRAALPGQRTPETDRGTAFRPPYIYQFSKIVSLKIGLDGRTRTLTDRGKS